MSEEKSFKHESMQDRASILAYLDTLREGFAAGTLVLSTKDKELILDPVGMIRFDIEAKRKGEHRKLTLKFAWRDQTAEEVGEEPLIIEAKPAS